MLEKDYPVPLDMLWNIWNERLRKVNSDIKELRITSIAVSVVLWFLIFISKSTASIVSISLIVAAIIWAMSYLLTIMPYGRFYYRETPFMDYDARMDRESFAMLLKDIEKSCHYMSRRLYLIRLLVSMSVLLTTVGVFVLILVTHTML